MGIRPTGSIVTGSVSLFGLYAVNLYHTIAPWDPKKIVTRICQNSQYGSSVMIGSAPTHGRSEWAYEHYGSWYVYGWGATQDPGTGGYWTPSSPIEGLEE